MQPKSQIVLAEKKLDWINRRITLDAGERLIPRISQNKSEWCRLRIADLQFWSVALATGFVALATLAAGADRQIGTKPSDAAV